MRSIIRKTGQRSRICDKKKENKERGGKENLWRLESRKIEKRRQWRQRVVDRVQKVKENKGSELRVIWEESMAGEAKERREVYSDTESFPLPGYISISEHESLCLSGSCASTNTMLLTTPNPEQRTGYAGSTGWRVKHEG